jgi:hypothetical protein
VEVEQVFSSGLGEDRVSREGSRMLLGQTDAGGFLRIIYPPDPTLNSVFVITAYGLQGKPLTGYKRRQRRRRRCETTGTGSRRAGTKLAFRR